MTRTVSVKPVYYKTFDDMNRSHMHSNPDKRDKCLHQIFFLLKNKKKISKALNGTDKNGFSKSDGIGGFS